MHHLQNVIRTRKFGQRNVLMAAAVIMGLSPAVMSGGLNPGVPTQIYSFDLNTDPYWTTEGMWEHGQPLGQGGTEFGNPDPTSGATGENVYGYNLEGDYPIDIGGPYWLTTGAVDCTGYEQVTLQFERWLNSDWQPWVRASIEVSNDGYDWVQVWENDAGEITDDSWTTYTYDIAAVADDAATVYVRWGHEVLTGGTWAYSGWNIDDIEIWGVPASTQCPADLTGDEQVNIDDIFAVLGLWGACPDPCPPYCTGDLTEDCTVNIDDIFAILGLWGPCI